MNARATLWHVFGWGTVVFMLSPLLILVLFCFSKSSLISFPLTGFSLIWFETLFARGAFWTAFENSLTVTGTVGVVSTVIGTMAAMGLSRMRRRFASVNIAALTLPVMLPPLVLGVALLTYYAGVGMKLGLHTVILSHLVFTQPFVILIVHARMANFDYAIVNSARDLGATPFRAFSSVTLPIVRPTVIGAALVAMALSIDDFIITIFTIGGGNTLPTFLWGMLRKGVNPSVNIVGLILLTVTICASLIALRLTRYRG
ncbi:MAG: ABC transporter permease [Alphaproteobacteria bacterium]